MKPQEFPQLVVTYGADISRWPAALQPAARSLLEATPQLQSLLSEAAQFDAEIRAQSAQISDVRIARLKALTLAKAHAQRASLRERLGLLPVPRVFERQWSWMAAGFASAVCLLILVQTVRPVADAQEPQSAIVALLEYDALAGLEVIR